MKTLPEDLATFGELTKRKQQLCAFLALGYSTEEIAELMGVSVASVNEHFHHIRKAVKLSKNLKLALFIARRPELEAFLRGSF